RTTSPLNPVTHIEFAQRNVPQTCPHDPQLNGSLRRSMHTPLQFESGGSQRGPHAKPSSEGLQRSFGATHWVKQSPKCWGVLNGGVQTTPPSPASASPPPPSPVPVSSPPPSVASVTTSVVVPSPPSPPSAASSVP